MHNDSILAKRIEAFKQRLYNCKDNQQIVDAATDFFQNPVIIFDIGYKLWAFTQSYADLDDMLWQEFITTGTFSPKTVLFVQQEFLSSYIEASDAAFMKSDKVKYNRINGGIFNKNGVQIANILILEVNKTFDETDFELIRVACKLVSEFLCNHIPMQSRMYGETLIGNLIESKAIDKTLFKDEIKELCHDLKSVLYVAVVDIMGFDASLTHIVYISEYLKKMCPELKCFVHLNNIIILLSFDEIVQNFAKKLKKLNDFFKEYKIYAGISDSFSNPFDMRKYFKHALDALNYGLIVGGGENIFNYDIFRLELFVNSHIDNVDITELCHPLVFGLIEFDKRQNCNYTQIIYHYLSNGMCPSSAAKSLGIDALEVKNAIRIVSKRFDIDWQNGNLLFSLARSIKLLKCFSEKLPNITIS